MSVNMAAMVQDRGYACAASLMVLIVEGGLMCVMGILYILFKNGMDATDEALSLIMGYVASNCAEGHH